VWSHEPNDRRKGAPTKPNAFIIGQECFTQISAVELSKRRKLSTAEAIVYATAQARDALLVTCDAHFEGLPQVLYFAK